MLQLLTTYYEHLVLVGLIPPPTPTIQKMSQSEDKARGSKQPQWLA